ncbi:MAG: ATP-grasp domain-containing protein [Actinobacteria bacterium]|nr:MAG: ATP-grasp domain-containing protein [Actinomycetota bacterium]
MSAGQWVIRVDHPGQLRQAIERARTIASSEGSSADRIVVETLIHGDEIALEGMVTDRGLTTLAIFDKPDPGLSGDGFQETILVTPSRQPPQTQTEIERVAAQSIRALGLTRGPVHVEMIVSGDRVDVIEVAARSIGGLCSRSLDFGLMDTSLETLILRNAIGRDKPELRRSGGASGVLMIPIPSAGELMSVAGLERVREIPEVSGVDITARPGDRLAPPPEGGRYVGFVFARSQRPEDVERALRDAMKLIEVKIR